MKLFKTKLATRNGIYNIVSPLTKGFFNDIAWENVNRVWKTLDSEGVVVTIVKSYYDNEKSKTWEFTAEVNGFKFDGRLVASFCGTVQNPTSRYDLCFLI